MEFSIPPNVPFFSTIILNRRTHELYKLDSMVQHRYAIEKIVLDDQGCYFIDDVFTLSMLLEYPKIHTIEHSLEYLSGYDDFDALFLSIYSPRLGVHTFQTRLNKDELDTIVSLIRPWFPNAVFSSSNTEVRSS